LVVGYCGDWRPPASVLSERQGKTGNRPEKQTSFSSKFVFSFRSGKRANVLVERFDTVCARDYKEPLVIISKDGVRYATPIEYERAQGFPDNRTLIPYNGRLASNAIRYKALGNSIAVPVLEWIGRRIQLVEEILDMPICRTCKHWKHRENFLGICTNKKSKRFGFEVDRAQPMCSQECYLEEAGEKEIADWDIRYNMMTPSKPLPRTKPLEEKKKAIKISVKKTVKIKIKH
jgi:hypothetical protein